MRYSVACIRFSRLRRSVRTSIIEKRAESPESQDRNRQILGSSLFGTNEIFAPVRSLKQELLRVHGKLPVKLVSPDKQF